MGQPTYIALLSDMVWGGATPSCPWRWYTSLVVTPITVSRTCASGPTDGCLAATLKGGQTRPQFWSSVCVSAASDHQDHDQILRHRGVTVQLQLRWSRGGHASSGAPGQQGNMQATAAALTGAQGQQRDMQATAAAFTGAQGQQRDMQATAAALTMPA